MELVGEDAAAAAVAAVAEGRGKGSPLLSRPRHLLLPGAARRRAYRFDGLGSFSTIDWDLAGAGAEEEEGIFTWHHVELPRGSQRLALNAQFLIEGSPPRASRCSRRSPASASLRRRRRRPGGGGGGGGGCRCGRSGGGERRDRRARAREFAHAEPLGGGRQPVPRTVANLVVHVVDTHVDQVQDIVTKLEMDLDAIEIELDKGGSLIKKQMLDDRRFPKMHLNLQRLLQVVSHGEQVFPRVKEKCVSKSWFTNEDVLAIGANKQKTLLSFLPSMIFLPLSIVTGVFGMNVGGVPWTDQKNPELKDGFINVMVICAAILFLLLLCFLFPSLYIRVSSWRSRHALKRSLSVNRRPFARRNIQNGHHRGDYMRL
uniref:Uncharacterized protein n=1 Tax=Ananas comosus var. bracteatus TaxID=296719 RepID=A0A6V7PUS2_ANACO|nr:unnamed protein product [Ananas comosus var. bracteatus]